MHTSIVRRVPPHFSQPPVNMAVFPGSDVNLTCVAAGSPEPYVSWHRGGVNLTPEDQIPRGTNILVLHDVRESANYTCVAENHLGKIAEMAKLTIKGTAEIIEKLSHNQM